MMSAIKLNLGCGTRHLKGYVNIDRYRAGADRQMDARHLDYADGSVDEVYSSHLIEHIPAPECDLLLREWHRVLKIGGLLVIRCPNIATHMRRWLEGTEEFRLAGVNSIVGAARRPGDLHRNLFDVRRLRLLVERAGFTVLSCEEHPSRDGKIAEGDLLCEASKRGAE